MKWYTLNLRGVDNELVHVYIIMSFVDVKKTSVFLVAKLWLEDRLMVFGTEILSYERKFQHLKNTVLKYFVVNSHFAKQNLWSLEHTKNSSKTTNR